MRILAYIYYLITSFRNFLYDKRILPIRKVEGVEIICIGNITVGGTGKTPAVQYFVKRLQKMGRKVAVVSRGYRGKRKREPLLVSDGYQIFATPKESGDETFMHAFLNLKVPIIVSSNRYKACLFAKNTLKLILLFLMMVSNIESFIVTGILFFIDATNPFGWGELLPKGMLREDFKKGAKRASEFIITKSDLVSEREVERIKKYLKKKLGKEVSIAKHGVASLCDLHGNQKPLFWIKGKRVLLFSGLANPLNFEKTVISLEPSYIERVDFMDHHNFKKKDIELIQRRADSMKAAFIIMTEKDLVKLPLDMDLENFFVLKIEFTILEDNCLKGIGGNKNNEL